MSVALCKHQSRVLQKRFCCILKLFAWHPRLLSKEAVTLVPFLVGPSTTQAVRLLHQILDLPLTAALLEDQLPTKPTKPEQGGTTTKGGAPTTTSSSGTMPPVNSSLLDRESDNKDNHDVGLFKMCCLRNDSTESDAWFELGDQKAAQAAARVARSTNSSTSSSTSARVSAVFSKLVPKLLSVFFGVVLAESRLVDEENSCNNLCGPVVGALLNREAAEAATAMELLASPTTTSTTTTTSRIQRCRLKFIKEVFKTQPSLLVDLQDSVIRVLRSAPRSPVSHALASLAGFSNTIQPALLTALSELLYCNSCVAATALARIGLRFPEFMPQVLEWLKNGKLRDLLRSNPALANAVLLHEPPGEGGLAHPRLGTHIGPGVALHSFETGLTCELE